MNLFKRLSVPTFALAITALFSLNAYALDAPEVIKAPQKIDADVYTLEIEVPLGSTVSVVGAGFFWLR
ncbi:hypothetical protein IPJ72_04615 [Candidatus Peregrinibacteria bacterium]|nr:MAG: hypothetical protein IPJ72_04615 [Candidatus Peregrinibacteria bacterium]